MSNSVSSFNVMHMINQIAATEQQAKVADIKDQLAQQAVVSFFKQGALAAKSPALSWVEPTILPAQEPHQPDAPNSHQIALPDLDGLMPPEIGAKLAELLVTRDTNGSVTLSPVELAQVFESEGLPGKEAFEAATALFEAAGRDVIGIDDIGAVQDALVLAWIAANPDRALDVLKDTATDSGLWLEAKEVVEGLMERGWSRDLAQSFARAVLPDNGKTPRNETALSSLIYSAGSHPHASALAKELETGLLLTKAAQQAQAEAAFAATELQMVSPSEAATTMALHYMALKGLVDSMDLDGDAAVTPLELTLGLVERGFSFSDATATAQAVFSWVAMNRGAAKLPASLSASDFMLLS